MILSAYDYRHLGLGLKEAEKLVQANAAQLPAEKLAQQWLTCLAEQRPLQHEKASSASSEASMPGAPEVAAEQHFLNAMGSHLAWYEQQSYYRQWQVGRKLPVKALKHYYLTQRCAADLKAWQSYLSEEGRDLNLLEQWLLPTDAKINVKGGDLLKPLQAVHATLSVYSLTLPRLSLRRFYLGRQVSSMGKVLKTVESEIKQQRLAKARKSAQSTQSSSKQNQS